MRGRSAVGWICLLALGCGPTVDVSDSDASTGAPEGTSSDGTTAPVTTTDTPGTTDADGTTTMDPTGTADSDPGGYEGDDGGTGCTFTCPDPPPPTPGVTTGGGGSLECDIVAQDCPEGEKCMPWANDGGPQWNATRCSPIARVPNVHGEPCTVEGSGVSGIDDCELGAVCWQVDPETNEGLCHDLCGAGVSCDDAEDSCATIDSFIDLCVQSCDPVAPDCSMEEGCQLYEGSAAFVCQAAGTTVVGDPCAQPDECVPDALCAYGLGIGCGKGAGEGCCAEVCDLNAPGACPGPLVCSPWIPFDSPPEYAHIGVCTPP